MPPPHPGSLEHRKFRRKEKKENRKKTLAPRAHCSPRSLLPAAWPASWRCASSADRAAASGAKNRPRKAADGCARSRLLRLRGATYRYCAGQIVRPRLGLHERRRLAHSRNLASVSGSWTGRDVVLRMPGQAAPLLLPRRSRHVPGRRELRARRRRGADPAFPAFPAATRNPV